LIYILRDLMDMILDHAGALRFTKVYASHKVVLSSSNG
jgi:hypothetical protein